MSTDTPILLRDDADGVTTLTLAIGKEAFYRQFELGLSDAYAYTRDVMVKNLAAQDAQEGIGAFIDKRPPVWCGR